MLAHGDAMRAAPFVPTGVIREAVSGRETEVLDALGIRWMHKSGHICCPYRDHDDEHPSWRWNPVKKQAHCTCTPSASILDVVCKVKGVDFETAKITAAEMLGRNDLIRQSGKKRKIGGRGEWNPCRQRSNTPTPSPLTLMDYAEAKQLPVELLSSLGLADVYLNGRCALKIPYFDIEGRRRQCASASRAMAQTNSDGKRDAGLYSMVLTTLTKLTKLAPSRLWKVRATVTRFGMLISRPSDCPALEFGMSSAMPVF